MSGAASQPATPPAAVPAPETVPSALWVGEGVEGEIRKLPSSVPPPLTPPHAAQPMGPAVLLGRWPEPRSAGGWLSFPGTRLTRSQIERSPGLTPIQTPPSSPTASTGPVLRVTGDCSGNGASWGWGGWEGSAWIPFVSFSALIAVAKTSKTMLNSSGESVRCARPSGVPRGPATIFFFFFEDLYFSL